MDELSLYDETGRKRCKIELDLFKGKQRVEQMAEGLKEKCDWIKGFKFRSKVTWIKNKQQMKEEEPFGLDMVMNYVDRKGKIKEKIIVFKYSKDRFYNIYLKTYLEKYTFKDLQEQFSNTCLVLGSGGTPKNPKGIIIVPVSFFPEKFFVNASYKNNRCRTQLQFGLLVQWKSVLYRDLFGDSINKELEKLRD